MRNRSIASPGGKLPGHHLLEQLVNGDARLRRYTGVSERQETQDSQGYTGSAPCEQRALSPSEIVDQAVTAYWQDDLRDTSGVGCVYHTPMWAFAREVRSSLPDGCDADEVFRSIVEPQIEKRGGWREVLCTDLDREDLLCDFVYSWRRIRYRIGEGPLATAMRTAEEAPLNLPASDPWSDLPAYRTLVSLAGWLQVIVGDQPIFLPRRRIGELLGRSHTQIMRYCANAVEQGYLALVNEHSLVRRRATEYRFDVSQFNTLLTQAGKRRHRSSDSF